MPGQSEAGTRSIHDKQLVRKRGGVTVEVQSVAGGGGDISGGITIDDVQQRLTTCRAVAVTDIAVDETTTTVDGVTLADGNIVLKADATANAGNRAYIVSTTTDWTAIDDVDANTHFSISEGDDHANTLWRVTTPAPIAVGTTAIEIRQCGKLLPYVLAQYSGSQAESIAASAYASFELDLATADISSAAVTTSPFVYTASADMVVDVQAVIGVAVSANVERHVFAVNVNDADVDAVFLPILRSGVLYFYLDKRLHLASGDTVKFIARAKNINAADPEDLTISVAEAIILTT